MTEKHPGMLITDTEITERWGPEVLAELDADLTTAPNQAMWGGKRYRPAVERALERRRKPVDRNRAV